MMGSTGCSFGQHLHFEIWKNSIFGGGINVDPATVLKR
jgi:murein DD-endopeptidase MepM/ murein hydrolase activator NlpD